MKPIKICSIVTGETITDFLKNLDSAQKKSDLIELRVDYLSSLDKPALNTIKNNTIKTTIFTCRKKDEGGKFNGSEEMRLELIRYAIDLGFEYIDIEYSTLKKIKIDKKKLQIIASYHDFRQTPKYWELTKLVFEMKQIGADIIKIATMVNKDYDLQVLYRVLLSKKPEEKQIIIGMGEIGKESRIIAPIMGSYLTYASIDENNSAPGQINIDKISKIYNALSDI